MTKEMYITRQFDLHRETENIREEFTPVICVHLFGELKDAVLAELLKNYQIAGTESYHLALSKTYRIEGSISLKGAFITKRTLQQTARFPMKKYDREDKLEESFSHRCSTTKISHGTSVHEYEPSMRAHYHIFVMTPDKPNDFSILSEIESFISENEIDTAFDHAVLIYPSTLDHGGYSLPIGLIKSLSDVGYSDRTCTPGLRNEQIVQKLTKEIVDSIEKRWGIITDSFVSALHDKDKQDIRAAANLRAQNELNAAEREKMKPRRCCTFM